MFAKSDAKLKDVSGGARRKLRMSEAAGAKQPKSLEFLIAEAGFACTGQHFRDVPGQNHDSEYNGWES